MRSGGGTLREVTGDLFSQETEGLALCHCVSRCLAMGKGIAVLFKRKFGGVEELRGQQLEVGDCGRLLRRVGVSGGARGSQPQTPSPGGPTTPQSVVAPLGIMGGRQAATAARRA